MQSSESTPATLVDTAAHATGREEAASHDVDAPAPKKRSSHRYVKGTFYLQERHDLILEDTRIKLRRKGDRHVDKSALVREAIDLLAAKYRAAE